MGVLNALMYGVAICLGIYVFMFLVGTGITIFIVYKIWKGIKQ